MDFSLLVAILSIGTALISFVLGIIVLGRNITNNLNFNFCIFAWLITAWEMLSYAFYINQNNLDLYKYSTIAGAVCLLAIAPWVSYLVKPKPNMFVIASFFVASILLFTIPFWDKNVMYNFKNYGNTFIFEVDFVYYIAAILVFLAVGYSFYLLIKSLFEKKGAERTRILLVLVGLVVYVLGELIMGLILPMLKATPAIPYDNFGAVFFVAFSSYAIMKYVPVDSLKSII